MKREWYYQIMGEIRGPVAGSHLQRLVDRNKISRETFVRREGEEWTTADRIGGLFTSPKVHSRSDIEPKMYYQVMGEIRGPVSTAALHRLVQTNSINRDTFIRQGDQDWVTADSVPGLIR